MTTTYRMSRRLFLAAGPGVLGIAVLGGTSGCGGSSSTTAGGASGSSASASGGASAGGPTGPDDTGPLSWKRVAMATVSAYLLVRGKQVALVDTGTPLSALEIGAALKQAGSDWSAVRHVIITHNHDDHAGGWESVEPNVKGVTAYAGEDDAGTITTSTPLKTVKDGDEIFGLRIVATPGHTLGHISVYDSATGVLVAGDALRTETGALAGSNPEYTQNEIAAAASMKKLAALDPKVILVGHGNPLQSGAAAALHKLAGV